MDAPNEKESGLQFLQKRQDEDVVESLMDNESASKYTKPTSLNPKGSMIQPKLVAPHAMRQKIKDNLEDSRLGKRPPSQ